jgi:glucoamylase
VVAGGAALALAVPLSAAALPPAAPTSHGGTGSRPTIAPGAPGDLSRFDLARKDCVGTAAGTGSKVWYTVADGVLSDVYEPTVDNSDVATLQYVVTDGSTFTDLQARDLTYVVSSDASGMECTVTATSAAHHYRLVTRYVTDPVRDTVLMHTTLQDTARSTQHRPLHLYARLDAHVNGNGGGGSANGGADTGSVQRVGHAAVSTVSQATNRDYAVPTFAALRSTSATGSASVGYSGTASDGLTQLDASHRLTSLYTSAPDGHVVLTEDVTPTRGGDVTLALGFGRTASGAVATAGASLDRAFSAQEAAYQRAWHSYDARLHRPPTHVAGLGKGVDVRKSYYLSANVLKASEDKTYPGAIAASLASPWGQAVSAGDLVGGKPVYFGSYREVFARDLYETFTGLMADGDLSTARDTVRFLFDRQQLADGSMPRNSLTNGKAAPDTGGTQLDETAYPILMAYESGLGDDRSLWPHVKAAADFLVAHGPSFGVERWEEQSGYSPSTIAAEIAGLTAAATIAREHGDSADASLYQATADDYQRHVKDWTLTTTGPYAARYFVRLTKDGNPDAGTTYGLGNGSTTVDQRDVVDGGFQDLVRLGELPATDPDVQASLKVLDQQLAVTTPTGTGYYRYGTSAAAGSADGYGDCYQPSQTSCTTQGAPWAPSGVGTGHLWPVLAGERAESDLATGDKTGAGKLLASMIGASSGVGLVPEQEWENPDLAAAPYGTDPTTASIGFADGGPAGSAAPLTWAQAQEVRLIADLGAGKVLDRPSLTTARYVTHGAPKAAPVTLTGPEAGSSVEAATAPVTGTTTPRATVVVQAVDTDLGTLPTTVTSTAAADGSFSVDVPVGFGTNVVTVGVTTRTGATGYAQTTVVGDITGGTTLLDQTDPSGDDDGPGTFQYPTAADFVAGSFDLTRFQVIQSGATTYLRTTLRTLTPTFGATFGAQLLDVYVHAPGAAETSTAAAFASRNYTIAPADAWTQRFEVQGFASPVWSDAGGNGLGTPTVVSSTVTKTVTIAVPTATFGTPGPGWTFSVVLAGQDGYSSDQARAFTSTAGGYSFGVCPTGSSSPVCAADPGSVPKAMDVLTPTGVDQATELDPTRGPVVVAGVPVS